VKCLPWLALLLPLALLALVPVAAQPCAFCNRETYLSLVPLVMQLPPTPVPPPGLAALVLRPEDTAHLASYSTVDEGPVDIPRAGREAAYALRMQSAVRGFLLTQVGSYVDAEAATAGTVALIARTDTTAECSAWVEYILLATPAVRRSCRLSGVAFENVYTGAAKGRYAAHLDAVCRASCSASMLDALVKTALAKLP